MGVNQRVCPFCECDVIDRVRIFSEVLEKVTLSCDMPNLSMNTNCFVELATQPKRKRTHAFHEKGDTEEIDLLLVDEDIYSRLYYHR